GERRLRRQEDAAVRAPAQLGPQAEAAHYFAHDREPRGHEPRRQQAVTAQQSLDLMPPPREAAKELRLLDGPAMFLTQCDLFGNQLQERLGLLRQPGVLRQ